MSEPAWHPDPTGRNQYRWWDGAAWTDSVSNNGVAGTDPLQAAAPSAGAAPQATPAGHATVFEPTVPQAPGGGAFGGAPTAGAAPGFGQPAFGSAPSATGPGSAPSFGSTDLPFTPATAKKSNPLKWIVPVVVLVAVGVALFLVLGGGDDGGGNSFGPVEGELEDDDSIVSFDYSLSRGDAIRIRVEPDRDLDTEVLVLVDADLAADYGDDLVDLLDDDFFTDADDFFTDAEDIFSDANLGELDDRVLLQSFDQGVEGEPDADFVLALADGTYTIAVKSWDEDSNGPFRLIVEEFEGGIDLEEIGSFSDFEEIFSDNDDFFSDDAFFSDEDEYEP